VWPHPRQGEFRRRHHMDDQFISLREAARRLTEAGHNITYWKLWDAATTGRIPARLVAGRRLLLASDLPQIIATFTAPADQ